MNYTDFAHKTCLLPYFSPSILTNWGFSLAYARLAFHRWCKQKKLIRLKRGFYTLPPEQQKYPLSKSWLSQALYSPSYLSLQYVLSFYGHIPEQVTTLTAVTTLKTQKFENALGTFTYRSIKNNAFFGFQTQTDRNDTSFLMASPEKALLDLIYFSQDFEATKDYLEKSLRLQQLENLSTKRLKAYAKKMDSPKVDAGVRALSTMILEEHES